MSQHPPPHGVVRKVYNQIAPKYAGLYEGEGPLPHFYHTRLELVRTVLRGKPVGTVLDIGSGPGIVGDTVRKLGHRYVAADASRGMARECRKRAGSGCEAVTARARALPFGTGSFEIVMALGVLEYVQDIEVALSECRRVLRHPGTFVVSLLNKNSPFRILKRVRRRLGLDPDPIPPVHFSRSETRRLLDTAGFDVRDVHYFDFEVLPSRFAEAHPRLFRRLTDVCERASSTPLRWLGSAMLVHAATV